MPRARISRTIQRPSAVRAVCHETLVENREVVDKLVDAIASDFSWKTVGADEVTLDKGGENLCLVPARRDFGGLYAVTSIAYASPATAPLLYLPPLGKERVESAVLSSRLG